MWFDKKLSLHLDHKNGINNDNKIKNLRFLCPNCHSQTSTYGGKSRKINTRV
jgi:5-methylcytosine-specific restriction endonuclease McrA